MHFVLWYPQSVLPMHSPSPLGTSETARILLPAACPAYSTNKKKLIKKLIPIYIGLQELRNIKY